MAGVSRNGIHLIKSAFAKLKGKFGKAFLATLIVVAPLMLCSFTIYGIVGAIAFFGIFQVGYIRYMRALIDDQNPSFALIFSEFTEPWMEVFLGIFLFGMYALGYTLFVIPGVVLVALFSMSFFLAEYKKAGTPFEAMKYSVKYMRGNYTNMFGFKVLFWLLYFIVLGVGVIGGVFVIKLWSNYKFWSILFLVLTYIVVTLAWTLVSVYYHTTQELFFRELLLYYEHRKSEEANKEIVIIEEEREVESEKQGVEPIATIVKEKKVEKKTPVRKISTTKSTATKSTTAKTTTTKTATKSTTAKKATTTTKTTKKQ